MQRIVGYVLHFIVHTSYQRQMRKPSKLITTTEIGQALISIIHKCNSQNLRKK